MRSILPSLSTIALLVVTGAVRAEPAEPKALPAPLGTRIADFTLPQCDGNAWSLAERARPAKAVVVVFLGTQCPISNAYLPMLSDLHQTYGQKGVLFVGINSNQQDDAAKVAAHAEEFVIRFHVLKDKGSTIADRFKAERVPEAFVLDAGLTVRYRGRIDDQFGKGVKRPKPTRKDLIEAIEEVLAGKAVSQPVVEAIGCPISRPAKVKPATTDAQSVTYSKHVAPILQRSCQGCHRPGEVGPFALMNYQDATSWAGAIADAIHEQRMPPWHADPSHGTFHNDRRLSAQERATIQAWVDQGCPEGNAAELPLPRQYVQGWGIGKPNEVIAMNKEISVPAQAPRGGLAYKYVLAGKPFAEDRWVEAAEVRPGNRGLVHHINVYVLRPGKKKLPEGDELEESLGKQLFEDPSADSLRDIPELCSYTPGDAAFELPPGMAKCVPKGSQIVFELHYVPNGKAAVDRSCVGLKYLDGPPKHEVFGGIAVNWAFVILPGAANHRVVATHKFDQDSVLLSMSPHMHLRGKSFEYKAHYPDGKSETLLSVPRYEFGWQATYRLQTPLKLPAGTRIECTAFFDNSADNPNNPDATATVRWGEQTWQEMMIGFVDYAIANDGK